MSTTFVISIDLEATGLSTKHDQITQVGVSIVAINDNTVTPLEPFKSFVKCKRAICEKAVEITGITNDMLDDAPTIDIVVNNLVKHLDNVCNDQKSSQRVLVGYNIFNYDIPLLVNDVARSGKLDVVRVFRLMKITAAIDLLPFARSNVDTTLLKRLANGKCSYKLGDVYQSLLGKPLVGAHDALVDTQAVIDLMAESKELSHSRILPNEDKLFNDDWRLNLMHIVDKHLTQFKHESKKRKKLSSEGIISVMAMFDAIRSKKKHKKP